MGTDWHVGTLAPTAPAARFCDGIRAGWPDRFLLLAISASLVGPTAALGQRQCETDPVSDDIFCQIIRGELPGEVVYRDDDVIAFLDLRPVFKGHVLVCPIQHADHLLDLPTDQLAPLFGVVQKIAAAMPTAYNCEGSFTCANTVVSQSVPHLHVHIIPRTKGDGLRGFLWPRITYAEGEATKYAAKLRTVLAA